MEKANSSFGRRGVRKPQPLARQPSRHAIYREGETPRPTFHGSRAELHWPKYGAAVVALLGVAYLLYEGGRGPFGLVLVPLILGFATYLVLSGIRKSANDIHALRTKGLRSHVFLAGALAGLFYFLFSTLFGDGMILWLEWGGPRPKFEDGFQRQDLVASATQIIKAIGLMACGGWLFTFLAKRFRRTEEAET